MQTECPYRRFYRLDAIRDELSPQTAECFDKLALFGQLRLEGDSQATALKAIGCSRATLYRWKRRLREPGAGTWPTAAAGELELVRQALRRPQAKVRPDGPDRPHGRRHRGRLLRQGVRGRVPGLEAVLHARLPARHRYLRLDRLIRQASFDIGPVQVDGGSESVAEFETACRRRGIALFAAAAQKLKI